MRRPARSSRRPAAWPARTRCRRRRSCAPAGSPRRRRRSRRSPAGGRPPSTTTRSSRPRRASCWPPPTIRAAPPGPRAARRAPASDPRGSIRPRPRSRPTAFTTTSAPTTSSPSRAAQVPTPPGIARSGPQSFATVAPVPDADPTLGDIGGCGEARRVALVRARSSRRISHARGRRSTAAGTVGTRTGPISLPIPRSSRYRSTPPALARPNALPPVRTIACATSMIVPGCRMSVPRVPGAPPRTSQEAIVPGGGRITVHPVSADLVGPVTDGDALDVGDGRHPAHAPSGRSSNTGISLVVRSRYSP